MDEISLIRQYRPAGVACGAFNRLAVRASWRLATSRHRAERFDGGYQALRDGNPA